MIRRLWHWLFGHPEREWSKAVKFEGRWYFPCTPAGKFDRVVKPTVDVTDEVIERMRQIKQDRRP